MERTTMEVRGLSSIVIPQSQYYADVREIPLTIFDRLAPNKHVGVLLAFRAPNAANSELIEGLLKTLVHFPVLGGELDENEHHKPCIRLGQQGGGVLVVEAEVQSNLMDHLPLEPSEKLMKLHPSDENPSHLLQVQLNRFACGGLLIGATFHHWIADGQSMCSFFFSWGKAVRGIGLHCHYDRDWQKARISPRCDFDCDMVFSHLVQPYSPSLGAKTTWEPHEHGLAKKVDNVLIHFSAAFINEQLKARVSSTCSRFDVVTAHLWRKITEARGLDPEVSTEIRLAVNARSRFPSVPADFFGNFVVDAHHRVSAKDLLAGSLADTARIIHDSVRLINENYIQSFIDLGEINQGEKLEPLVFKDEGTLCPSLEVDSWLGFSSTELDFGQGRLCGFLPSWETTEGIVVLFPSLDGNDKRGVDAVVTLFDEHAEPFIERCYLGD